MAGFVPECQSTKNNTYEPKVVWFGPELVTGFKTESVAGFRPVDLASQLSDLIWHEINEENIIAESFRKTHIRPIN